MKKILMTLMVSMLLLSSSTYAQGAATHNTSFSKKDAQALFGTQKVKTITLNNGEMKDTEGEWLQFSLPLLVGIIAGVAGHTVADQSGYLHPDRYNNTPCKRI